MPYLYVMEMQIPGYPFNPIKIGYSGSPISRFQQFTHGPFPTVSLGTWKVRSRAAESFIHSAYEQYRLVGEWFYPAAELREFISKRIKGEPQPLNDKKNLTAYEERIAKLGVVEPVTVPWLLEGLIAREERINALV